MPKKPSSMKRTGKAKAKPAKKNGRKYLGTGVAKKGAGYLTKAKKARLKALKEFG